MSKFRFTQTGLDGLTIIEPNVFGGERGYFMETYSNDVFVLAGTPVYYVQDDQSKPRKGVLRGLHFHKQNPQSKLVRIINGEVHMDKMHHALIDLGFRF